MATMLPPRPSRPCRDRTRPAAAVYGVRVLDVALPLLACPVCGGGLTRATAGASSLVCPAGHRHDVARQGYVNLLSGRGAHGLIPDSTEMVLARDRIQGAGLYAPIADALAAAADRAPRPDTGGLLDVGGGTGYYAAHVLAQRPDLVGVGLDLSRAAARRAARAHPRKAALCRHPPQHDGIRERRPPQRFRA